MWHIVRKLILLVVILLWSPCEPAKGEHPACPKPACPDESAGVNKVALLSWGLARSMTYTIASIRDNLFGPLETCGIDYEVFMHSFKLNRGYVNRRNGVVDPVHLDPEEWRLLEMPDANHVSENQDEVAASLNLRAYRGRGDPWNNQFRSLDNFILALYSRKQVTELFARRKAEFQRVIFFRTDVEYLNPLPTDVLTMGESTLAVPGFDAWGGMNDRWAAAAVEVAIFYGTAYDHLLAYTKTNLPHSETFMRHVMADRSPFNVKKVGFFFARIRANGETHKGDNWMRTHVTKCVEKCKPCPVVPKKTPHYGGLEWIEGKQKEPLPHGGADE